MRFKEGRPPDGGSGGDTGLVGAVRSWPFGGDGASVKVSFAPRGGVIAAGTSAALADGPAPWASLGIGNAIPCPFSRA